MENSAKDLSSTANHPFSGDGDGAGAGSEESGWTSYIDYFMETQRRQEAEASSAADPSTDDGCRRSTSEYSGECGVGGSARLPALVEPLEESRRLSLKKEGRRKKVLYDESLEDTATSPISSPKLIELRDSDANHHKIEDAYVKFSHSKKTGADGLCCYNHNNSGANTTANTTIKDDQWCIWQQ